MSIDPTISTGIYVVELSRWGISNDGTNAVETSQGINLALNWASDEGYTEVVLPRGVYLIDEKTPIEPPSYLTLNLNRSTMKINTNGLEGYSVISFKRNQEYSRVTNGELAGDRGTHDYSSGGTHEGGYGISVGSFTPPADGGNNTRYIMLDNLDIHNFTGDSVTLNSSFGQIFPIPSAIASSWEQGSIDVNTGALMTNTSKIRMTIPIDMTQSLISKYGYFGLYGNGYGSLGSDIRCDYYDVIFYKSDNSFLSSKTFIQFFDEIEVPDGANCAKVVLHQPNVPTPANCHINVRTPTFPRYTFIEKCNMHHNRRQGISVCGAKHLYVSDNDIHHISGTDPQSGIDIEDGYDLNQFIHIHKNTFHDNEKYNIIAVNGKCIYITDNTLLKTNNIGYVGLAINGGVDRCIVSGNTIRHNKVNLSGETQFLNNHVYGTQVNIAPAYSNRPISISSNTFYDCKFVLDSPFSYLVTVDNCRFVNGYDKLNALSSLYAWTIEYKQSPQKFSNCTFEGADVSYFAYTPSNATKSGWIFENCFFNGTGLPLNGRLVSCDCTDTPMVGRNHSSSTGLLTDVVELHNCRLISTDRNNTLWTISGLKSFVMKDCHIEKSSGWVIRIQNVSEEVILKGNTIKVVDDTLPRALITLESSFTGSVIMIDGNYISAKSLNQVGIDNQTTNGAQIAITNNLMKKTSIKGNGSEVLRNNIIDGVIDPYYL